MMANQKNHNYDYWAAELNNIGDSIMLPISIQYTNNQSWEISLKWYKGDNNSSVDLYCFGNPDNSPFCIISSSNRLIEYFNPNWSQILSPLQCIPNITHTLTIDNVNGVFIIDGTRKNYSISAFSGLLRIIGTEALSSGHPGKIAIEYHSIVCRENGVITHDLRPFIDNNGNKCIKDIITGVLSYPNSQNVLHFYNY